LLARTYRCDATGVVGRCASGDPIKVQTLTATMIDAIRHHIANRRLLFGMPGSPELSGRKYAVNVRPLSFLRLTIFAQAPRG
jgi:hypothetical protein